MKALIVPMAGVCLVFGLRASEAVPTPDDRASQLASQGIALHRANRNGEARPVLEQALAAGARDTSLISTVLANVDRSLGDYQSAERVLRAAARDQSATDAGRATALLNLADLLREESRETEANDVLDEAMRFPDLPRGHRISVLIEKAELGREMHNWQASVADWNKVGEIAAADHSRRLEEIYTGGLGDTWFAAGDLARAEPLLRRSLQLLRDDPDSSSSQIAVGLALMARLYMVQNKLALAGEAIDEAISRDVQVFGSEHPQVAIFLQIRAGILSRRGEAQPARDDLEHARIIMASRFGPESSAVGGVAAALGDVEQRANRPAAAAAAYGFAMKLLHAAGADSARVGATLVSRYAAALKAADRPGEAKALVASGK